MTHKPKKLMIPQTLKSANTTCYINHIVLSWKLSVDTALMQGVKKFFNMQKVLLIVTFSWQIFK